MSEILLKIHCLEEESASEDTDSCDRDVTIVTVFDVTRGFKRATENVMTSESVTK